MEAIAALRQQAEAKFKEAMTLLQDPAGDATKAETLLTEANQIKGRVQMLLQAEEGQKFFNEPAGEFIGHGGVVGHADVDVKTGRITESAGEGELNNEQKSLIASTGYKNAFRKWIRAAGFVQKLGKTDYKAIAEGTDGYGGFLVPEDFVERVIQKRPAPTRTADFVRNLSTDRDTVVFPAVRYTADDKWTSGVRMTWTGEQPASATSHRVNFPVDGTNGFGQVRIPIYTAMLSLLLTENQIEDTGFDVTGWAADEFRTAVDLGRDNFIANGTGIGQPTGILANPGQTNTPAIVYSGNASALTADGVLKLFWQLPPQYEENCRFLMNKTSAGQAVALLKDSNNRYLWGMGLQDSGMEYPTRQRVIAGYPVTWNVFMPDVASNSYSIIFGDPMGYYLINRRGFSIRILNELYAETNQVEILGRLREGGDVAEPWRLKIQQTHS